MRPNPVIYTSKRDDEHPRLFRLEVTSLHSQKYDRRQSQPIKWQRLLQIRSRCISEQRAMYYSCCWRMWRTAESGIRGRKRREERGGHFTLNQFLVSLSLQLRSDPFSLSLFTGKGFAIKGTKDISFILTGKNMALWLGVVNESEQSRICPTRDIHGKLLNCTHAPKVLIVHFWENF